MPGRHCRSRSDPADRIGPGKPYRQRRGAERHDRLAGRARASRLRFRRPGSGRRPGGRPADTGNPTITPPGHLMRSLGPVVQDLLPRENDTATLIDSAYSSCH
jgi:hypothetical protein